MPIAARPHIAGEATLPLTRRRLLAHAAALTTAPALAALGGCDSEAARTTTRGGGQPSGGGTTPTTSASASVVATPPPTQPAEPTVAGTAASDTSVAGGAAAPAPTPPGPGPAHASPAIAFVSDTSTASRAALAAAVTRAIGPEMRECSVSVLDRRTGVAWQYRGTELVPAGSVSKALIVAQALRQARAEDTGFSSRQRSWAKAAITQSANSAASSLYEQIGGHIGVAALARDLGMSATADAHAAGHWGSTLVTSNDLVTMMRAFTDDSPVTHPDDDAYLLDLMGRVISGQRWGVGTVRSGAVAVRIKNGWMAVESPTWVINSVGDVRGNGRDYVLTILLRHQRSQEPAMARSSSISRAVYTVLRDPLT